MFSELMPVLQHTIVTLTISRIDDQLVRVNIIPIRKTDKESDAENALSKPLTVTAPPAELDQDFARQVLSFSHSYERSAANIREIEEAHAAAVKAAEEERKNEKARKSAAPGAKTSPRSENDSKAAPGGKPVFGSKGQSATAPAATTQSLFETPAGEAKGAPEKDEPTGVTTVVEGSEPENRSAADGEPPAIPITSPVRSTQCVVETGSSPHPVEQDICDICKYPILLTQERHPFMPVPAHASAMDCQRARVAKSGK
jgi:PRTRC genetic system protein E